MKTVLRMAVLSLGIVNFSLLQSVKPEHYFLRDNYFFEKDQIEKFKDLNTALPLDEYELAILENASICLNNKEYVPALSYKRILENIFYFGAVYGDIPLAYEIKDDVINNFQHAVDYLRLMERFKQ